MDALNSEIFHLINAKRYDEAFKKADRVTYPLARSNWFGIIADEYNRGNQLDKAFKAARKIPADMDRSAATLQTLAKKFMQQNQDDKAIEAAVAIKCTGRRSTALRLIGEELVKQGKAQKALQVAALIPIESSRIGIIESANALQTHKFVLRLNFGKSEAL